MTDTEPETDAEVVERMRKNMQTATDAALAAYAKGDTFEQFSDDFGLPTEMRRVMALDLRLLGAFVLDFSKAPSPAPFLLRTQWVFQHAAEDAYYVVGFENVLNLEHHGYATLRAFVNAGDAS